MKSKLRPFAGFGLVLLLAASGSVFFGGPAVAGPLRTHPLPPTGVTVTPGNEQAVITWQPNLGGCLTVEVCYASPSGYVAKAAKHGVVYQCTVRSATASGCTITGLTNGITYKVRVYAYTLFTTGRHTRGPNTPPVEVTPIP